MGAGTAFVVIILIVSTLAIVERRRNTRIIDTRTAYHASLTRLRRQPSDTAIYDHTRQLGRQLIALIAHSHGTNTPFSEATLQNDLDTATRP